VTHLPLPVPPVLLGLASRLYGTLARWRRRRASGGDGFRLPLRRPVISVGNLAVGGSGKTPIVAALAEWLRDRGEYPAILSRGYARARPEDGVVVVRTGDAVLAPLDVAGDEPLMLARRLDGVAVVVAADRHLAGCLAESRLGCTVHILDDGFQHFRVARDIDLLVVSAEDLKNERVLPAGRLREPLDAAAAADALLLTAGSLEDISNVADLLAVDRRFLVRRALRVPRMVDPWGAPPRQPRSAPVVATAGIARPERFFDDLRAAEWQVAGTCVFGDHHRYTRADAVAVAARATTVGATLVLTTEKDLVRWLPLAPLPFPLAWVPLEASIEPFDEFCEWLLERLATTRRDRPCDDRSTNRGE
jgi:tetraacyldisaccharide 4'-kinase